MARPRRSFQCSACSATAASWAGRCGSCGEWNTLTEDTAGGDTLHRRRSAGSLLITPAEVTPITEVSDHQDRVRPTGMPEVDRVLGGGLVPGSVTLLGGEPGIGKSTLLLQLAAEMAGPRPVLYASAEESIGQVRSRAARLGALVEGLLVVGETVVDRILSAAHQHGVGLVVIDSVQTVHDPDEPGLPGSPTQVRAVATRAVRLAKEHGMSVVLVGHVTKEGTLAGPRSLEHVVDTVLSFEGDRQHSLRLLRSEKHRFGSTAEVGVFEMEGEGLRAVDDPSGLFLADRLPGTVGSAIAPTLDGRRALLVEIQALVARAPVPRRTATGLDGGRLAALLAVLEQRAAVSVGPAEVFASVAGGVRACEPAIDLGVTLALASAMSGVAVPPDLVATGEVGLGGEIRQVTGVDRRVAEADRMGFRRMIVPRSTPHLDTDIALVRANTVAEALLVAGLG